MSLGLDRMLENAVDLTADHGLCNRSRRNRPRAEDAHRSGRPPPYGQSAVPDPEPSIETRPFKGRFRGRSATCKSAAGNG